MQDKKIKGHWDGFYKKKLAPINPSEFCRFILDQELEGKTCVDIGCGNGRDTFALGDMYATMGIDPSGSPQQQRRIGPERTVSFLFEGADDKGAKFHIKKADIVYSRFWMHTVGQKESLDLLGATTKYFCAETRIAGDEPKLYTDHDRKVIDPDIFVRDAMLMGFELIYFRKGRGMAEYKNEDPLIARFILKRK